ncbi:cobalamin-binding protein [Geobacillus thermodenitrificans]|uniref:cobalamin-binding protein n=1 Tax=Geobacillus thermodenitrificans TaxID=33940 RepID=UPI00040EFD74|nr:cobalamin-binding protein [Geobacillus thermodenitrificans]ARA98668.1 cobalamin-binding protein [Geobacillus thermodenitrificans]MEC5187741.1 iron complex transport system substrate-binding protein [Geobacillus thermodenitrificans]MED4917676.1 cobalamin-binding protein [Geobacillus thermodenitrificans]PJW19736.1 cobalamin-binding protein [Geobacillus thermodenitrificans]
MRIVSLCPSNTEMLAYLGRLDDVIAVDQSSDWPPAVKQLPTVGPDLRIDMDEVEALKPDLVVASLSVPGMERNVEELARRRLPHLVLAPHSLDDIASDLLRLGEALGEKQKAAELARRYHECLNEYREWAAAVTEPARLYWEWWPRPLFTPGGANWLSELSELAGGRNIFADCAKASVQTEWDEVVARNPSHILLVWVGVQTKKMNANAVTKRPNAEQTEAVRTGRIHLLEEALYCRPSPRLLIGLKKLAPLLHPALFPPADDSDPLFDR